MESDSVNAEDLMRHGVFLRRLITSIVRDATDADDVLQDTWLVAMERPPLHQSNLGAWLAVVARRLALRRGRTRRRRSDRERAAAQPDLQPSTADVVATVEWHQAVAASVMRLSEPVRSAIVQRFHEGATFREVAARQGTSVATALNRVREGIRRMRQDLDRQSQGRGSTKWQAALAPLALQSGSESSRGAIATLLGGATVSATTKSLVLAATVGVGSFFAGWHARPLAQAPEGASRAAPPEEVTAPMLAGRTPPERASRPTVATQPEAAPQGQKASLTPDEWLQRILESKDAIATGRLYRGLAKLPAEEGREVLLAIYGRIQPAEKRMIALQAWAGPPPHPHFLAIMNVALGDPDISVEQLALRFLPYFGLPAHSDDEEAYERWYEEHGARPIAEVARDTLMAWYDRIRALSGDALRAALASDRPALHIRLLTADRTGIDSARLLRGAGALDLAASWLASGDPELAANGMRWIAILGPDDGYLRQHVLPLVEAPEHHHEEVMNWAYRALGRPGADWAMEPLLQAFVETPRRRDWGSIAGALSAIGDKRAIPSMIGMIIADDTRASIHGIGHFGLSRLTGIPYAETHDAAWWQGWWDEHRQRLDPRLARMELPSLRPIASREPKK